MKDTRNMQRALNRKSRRAERKAGELLREMEKNVGSKGNGKVRSHDVTTLSDLGISKMQSSKWQKC